MEQIIVTTSKQDFANLERTAENSMYKKSVKQNSVNLKFALKDIQMFVNILPHTTHVSLERNVPTSTKYQKTKVKLMS